MSDEIREIDVEDLDSFISIVEGAFPVIELHEPGERSDFK